MKINECLKRQRILAGMTQEELAEKLGIPHSSISAYETGMRGARPGRIKELAEALGCSIADIIGSGEKAV